MKKILVLAAAMAMVFTSCNEKTDTPTPDPVIPPAFKVELERAIEGEREEVPPYNPTYTYEKIDSVVFTAEDDGWYEIRIKADVDWIIDEKSIPAVFDAYDFQDDEGAYIGAKKGEFSQVITLAIDDESKMETLPSIVTLKVKDIATSKTVDVVIKLTGVGDTFITRTDEIDDYATLAKTGVKPLVYEVSYSPAYDFKVVAMKGDASGYMNELAEATWVKITRAAGKAALSKANITLAIEDNTGEPRGAAIYAIPATASISDVFEGSDGRYRVKESYQDKAFELSSIKQAGNVKLIFDESQSNTLTKNIAAAEAGGNPFNPGFKIALTTTAYLGDGPNGGIMLEKGVAVPEWIKFPGFQGKEFQFSVAENTGAERTAVLEFFYYDAQGTGTLVGTLTVVQAAGVTK